jgi:secreted PhoX family phosphatase
VIARALEPVPGTSHEWHPLPDGGATFRMLDQGWVYVSNSEFLLEGGVGALRFDANGRLLDAYGICQGSFQNCAGGPTPWGTWLTCEELANGTVFECDPSGALGSQRRLPLGTFKHEAAAVDPATGIVYLTEDEPTGAFYRFVPNAWGNLSSGRLEVAEVDPAGRVRWHAISEPNPSFPGGTPTREQVPESTAFDGGEGIVYSRRHVYFTTKGDHRVWDYRPWRAHLGLLYDGNATPDLPLRGVDNITASRHGELVVAEDGGNMELVMITRTQEVTPILRVIGQDRSELAGPAFDPSGRRLYVSSQRGGPRGLGITYEITGPFHKSVRGALSGGVPTPTKPIRKPRL